MLLVVFPKQSPEVSGGPYTADEKTYVSTVLPRAQPKDVFYHELIDQHFPPVDQPLLVIVRPGEQSGGYAALELPYGRLW